MRIMMASRVVVQSRFRLAVATDGRESEIPSDGRHPRPTIHDLATARADLRRLGARRGHEHADARRSRSRGPGATFDWVPIFASQFDELHAVGERSRRSCSRWAAGFGSSVVCGPLNLALHLAIGVAFTVARRLLVEARGAVHPSGHAGVPGAVPRRGRAAARARPRLVLHHRRARARRLLRVGVAGGVGASRAAAVAARCGAARRAAVAASPALSVQHADHDRRAGVRRPGGCGYDDHSAELDCCGRRSSIPKCRR